MAHILKAEGKVLAQGLVRKLDIHIPKKDIEPNQGKPYLERNKAKRET